MTTSNRVGKWGLDSKLSIPTALVLLISRRLLMIDISCFPLISLWNLQSLPH